MKRVESQPYFLPVKYSGNFSSLNGMWTWFLGLRLAYGVVLDEMFELKHLVGRQLFKLHTRSSHSYRTERDSVTMEIRNGSKRHPLQIESPISQEYV